MTHLKKICSMLVSSEEISLIKYNGLLYLETNEDDTFAWKNILLHDEVILISKDSEKVLNTIVVDKFLYLLRDDQDFNNSSPLAIKFVITEIGDKIHLTDFSFLQRFRIIDVDTRNDFLDRSVKNIIVVEADLSIGDSNQIIYKEGSYELTLAKTSDDFMFIYNLSKYHSFGLRRALINLICKYKNKKVGAVVFDVGNNDSRYHYLALKVFRSKYFDLRKNGVFIHRLYNDIDVDKKNKIHEVLINATIKVGLSILKEKLTFVEGVSYDYHPIAEKLKFNIEIPDKIHDSFYFWKPFHASLNRFCNDNINFVKARVHDIVQQRALYKYWIVIGTEYNIRKGVRQKKWALSKNKNNSGRWHTLNLGDLIFFYSKDNSVIASYGIVKSTNIGTIGKYSKFELLIDFSSIEKSADIKIDEFEFEKIYNPYAGGIFPITSKIGLFLKNNIDNYKNKLKMWVNPNPYLLHLKDFTVVPKQLFLIQAYSLFDSIYPVIKEILNENEYKLKYFTERNGQVVFDDIWNLMNESQAVIVDFTLKRPNVYLEYGMALVLGKPIIAITQNMEDIPSDTPNLKCIKYEDRKGDRSLENKLVKTIVQTITDLENINNQGISVFDNK